MKVHRTTLVEGGGPDDEGGNRALTPIPVSLLAASPGPPWRWVRAYADAGNRKSDCPGVRLRVSTLGHRGSMTASVSRGTTCDAIGRFAFPYGRRILPWTDRPANRRSPKPIVAVKRVLDFELIGQTEF